MYKRLLIMNILLSLALTAPVAVGGTQIDIKVIAPVNTDPEPPISVTVYPNPAIDYFTLKSNVSIDKIIIVNVVGKKVKTFKVTTENKYPVDDLRKGIYIISFFDQNDRLLKSQRLSKS